MNKQLHFTLRRNFRTVFMILTLIAGSVNFLFAQTSSIVQVNSGTYIGNNGLGANGQVVFAVQNTNTLPIRIDTVRVAMYAGTGTFNLWYNPTITAAVPTAVTTANGWIFAKTGSSVTSPTNGTIMVAVTGANVIVPPNATYRFAIGGTIGVRYRSWLTTDPRFFTADSVNVLVNSIAPMPLSTAYGGVFPNFTNTPRSYVGAISFTEVIPGPPTVLTGSKQFVTNSGATLSASITDDGASTITSSGIVVGTSANPTIGAGGVIDSTTLPVIGMGNFTKTFTGLGASTTYYYRTYATNAIGTSYGPDSTFTTAASALVPSVNRIAATALAGFSATVGGSILSNGGSAVFTSGVVYGTNPNPVIGGPGVVDSTTNPAVTNGNFSFNLAGLNHSTKYYFRAYAINGVGTAYSTMDSFNTNPVITYLPYAQNFDTTGLNTGWTSAPVTGALNDWIMGTPAKTTLTAAFSTPNAWITKLTANYSTSHDASLVSPQFDFSTLTANPLLRFKHKFYTESCCDGGFLEVSINGGAWTKVENTVGTGTNFNTVNGTAWYNGTTQGNTWNNLSSAYATATNGWITSMIAIPGAAGQSNVKFRFRFITDTSVEYDGWEIDNVEVFSPSAPTVLTGTKTNITTNSVTLAGNITNDGGAIITASGIVIGTATNPARGGTGVVDSTTSPLVTGGTFTKNIGGLTPATLYHYRAYAVNGIGTSYGPDSTFTTNASAVVATVLRTPATNIGGFTATLGGNITSDGGSAVYISGIVYATTNNPLVGGIGVIDSVTTPNIPMGNYSFNLTGLNHSTRYYYRAYAVNSVGVAYSVLDSFNTNPVITYLPYAQNFDTIGLNTGWNSAATGGVNDWQLGTPAKTQITAAYSGANAWVTKLTGLYSNSANCAVVSPQFDFSSITVNPIVKFRHNFNAESSWDGGVLEADTTGTGVWFKIDNVIGTGPTYNTANSTGWYNGTANAHGGNAWQNTSTGYTGHSSGWIQSKTTIPGCVGKSNVRIRFRFASDGSVNLDNGWALDNIEVLLPGPPTVATGTKTNITMSNVTLAGSITNDGGVGVTTSGIVVGTVTNPAIGGIGVADSITVPLVGSGPFTLNFSGLSASTMYHYRAYAINAMGTSYGPDSVFVTNASAVPPSVSSVAAININTTTARVGANITSNGGSAVYLSGIVIATTTNPVIGGVGVIDSFTTPTITLGTFGFNLSGLTHSTKYYFRAYATNVAGNTYSNLDSFTTAPIIATLPYTQNFEAGAGGWASMLTSTNTSVNWILGFATNNNWVLGTPAKLYLNRAHSGIKAWVTKISGDYDIDHDASVVSPQFDFTSYTADPVVRFSHKFKAESDWDGLIVEVSINNGYWRRMDSIVGTGTNYNTPNSYSWYNDNVNFVPSGGYLAPPYFSNDIGSASIFSSQDSGWIQSAFRLTGAAGQSNVRFRFRFIADTYVTDEGWALDDIEVVNIVTPTTAASSVTATSPNASTMNVSWTNGNGNARLVVARLNSISAIAPSNNIMYNASAVFGSANITGAGNFIVYNGTGNSITVTGLATATLYSFDVYEYNGKYMHTAFAVAASNSATTLPVKLISFTGVENDEDAELSWITAQEINNSGFEVQRSLDGQTFSHIGFVKGAGNYNGKLNYAFVDANIFQTTALAYYRLKQMDKDGKFEYSNTLTLRKGETNDNQVKIYPNPFASETGVFVQTKAGSNVEVQIFDMQGRELSHEVFISKNGSEYLSLKNSDGLKNGIYFVRVSLNGEIKTFKAQKSE